MKRHEVNRIVYNYFVLNNFKNRNDMNYALTELKEQQPLLRQYHSKMLRIISTKVAGASSAVEELKKKGRKIGKLQLLKPGECHSFVYNQFGFKVETNYDDNGKCMLYLAKIGKIEIRVHCCLYDVGQVTVVKQAGKWHAILVCKVMRRRNKV